MPTYNQLAASSLLNQQYAALGLGTVYNVGLVRHVNYGVSSFTMFLYLPSVPGLHGIPARRAPMVEQAVQTVPLVAGVQKRGKAATQLQSRQPVRPTQRSGQDGPQRQKGNPPTSKQTKQWHLTSIYFNFLHHLKEAAGLTFNVFIFRSTYISAYSS